MQITCIHCGERGSEEFAYLGDASVERPDGNVSIPLDERTFETWAAYVYLRENPAGLHRELWYHSAGCRAWLVVTRDITTHQIHNVEAAQEVALARVLEARTSRP